MKYCVSCGASIEETVDFCPFCGQSQPLTSVRESNPPNETQLQKKKKSFKSDISDIVGCILCIGVIITLIFLYIVFQNLADLIITIIVIIGVFSCVFRLIFGSIGELLRKHRKKKLKKGEE